jgi:hypothetical protein
MGTTRAPIEVGQRFSNCVVLRADYSRGKLHWRCRCDCGVAFVAVPFRLVRGTTTSCISCKKKANGQAKVVNLKGRRFGRLSVLDRAGSNKVGQAVWRCQCDCGSKPVLTTGHRLLAKTGPTRSCGCLAREASGKRQIDLIGKTFGKLTVVKYERNDFWACRCACGTSTRKRGQFLREGRTLYHCGSFVCDAEDDFVGPILPRAEAKRMKLKRYSPGRKCKRGHFGSHLVSNMSCELCHQMRGFEFKESYPEKMRLYDKRSRERPEFKLNRNASLFSRRNDDPIFRCVELLRTRVGKTLRRIKVKKTKAFNRGRALEKAIYSVLQRQGLSIDDIKIGQYELDHIEPLAVWMWSASSTANKLIENEANGAGNLQFLSLSAHRRKTKKDFEKHGWSGSGAVYKDHTESLHSLLLSGSQYPSYFVGYEPIIIEELKTALTSGQQAVTKKSTRLRLGIRRYAAMVREGSGSSKSPS